MRQILPYILPHTPDTSLPFSGGDSTGHRRTDKKTKITLNCFFYCYKNEEYKLQRSLYDFDFHKIAASQETSLTKVPHEMQYQLITIGGGEESLAKLDG